MSNVILRVLMVAAENDGLVGGKVGGIGDVVRDVPPELARKNCEVAVVTPSYGYLHRLPGSAVAGVITFKFAGQQHGARVHEVPGKQPCSGVRHFVIDHPRFESYDKERGQHQIYSPDPPGMPFARDASKYALFCVAVAESVKRGVFGRVDCVHLHDWHTAFLLILRRYDANYESLKNIRTVYTIHNLAIQGVRPLSGAESSLATWYPELKPDRADLADPRWADCVNAVAVGVRLADAVHTVSPSYAEEIIKPSDIPRFYGGEGLESDLLKARADGRLFGILNGCQYPPDRQVPRLDFHDLLDLLKWNVLNWAAKQQPLSVSNFIAIERLTQLGAMPERPELVMTSVSRAVDQKMFLMTAPGTRFKSGLQGILESLGKQGIYVVLATGDVKYERYLAETSARFENFVFLNGFSDMCARALYANGDLFLMPSSFEPCGISQMLAMRDGQPCLVHRIGGLKDTVIDGINGFSFAGESVAEQVDNFVLSCLGAIETKQRAPNKWRQICQNASESRFLWEDTVSQYIEKLYK